MKSPIVIESPSFDWKRGREAMDAVISKSGEVNWGAAMAADPGVTKCPKCSTYFWKEANKPPRLVMFVKRSRGYKKKGGGRYVW